MDSKSGTRHPVHLSGELQWISGFDRIIISKELTPLRNAAYNVVAIMTMMRDGEVQSIATGAVGTHYGALAVTGMLHKMQPTGGKPQRWWVSDPVVRALKVLNKSPSMRTDCSAPCLRACIATWQDSTNTSRSGRSSRGQRPFTPDCLDPVPTPLAPHMFRRTVITANEPDGEIALGITLKHNAIRALANATTGGYGAPTPEWAKVFEHHAKEATASELVADWARHAQGGRAARGPGATNFVNGLAEITDRANTTAAISNERMLRDLLRDEFSTIRLGTLNHCLGDPTKALRLEGASAAVKAGGPIPSMCQPATCGSSVITDKHLDYLGYRTPTRPRGEHGLLVDGGGPTGLARRVEQFDCRDVRAHSGLGT